MTSSEKPMASVRQFLFEATDPTLRFPARVIAGDAALCLFIDGDCLFARVAPSLVNDLLAADDGQCMGMCNLAERREGLDIVRATEYFWRGMTREAYFKKLASPRPPRASWASCVDDFAYSSDTGRWCIVVDKALELAVMAIRRAEDMHRFGGVVDTMRGRPIEEALKDPPSFGLVTRERAKGRHYGLREDWRRLLLENYAGCHR